MYSKNVMLFFIFLTKYYSKVELIKYILYDFWNKKFVNRNFKYQKISWFIFMKQTFARAKFSHLEPH